MRGYMHYLAMCSIGLFMVAWAIFSRNPDIDARIVVALVGGFAMAAGVICYIFPDKGD